MFLPAGRAAESRTVRITPSLRGLLMVILGVQAPKMQVRTLDRELIPLRMVPRPGVARAWPT